MSWYITLLISFKIQKLKDQTTNNLLIHQFILSCVGGIPYTFNDFFFLSKPKSNKAKIFLLLIF